MSRNAVPIKMPIYKTITKLRVIAALIAFCKTMGGSAKASALITEMEKAVYKDPQPYATPADSYSGYNKYNRFPKQF